MARKRSDDVTQEAGKLVLAAYVLHALDLLPERQEQALDHVSAKGVDWRKVAANGLLQEYDLDAKGIKKIYTACAKHMDGVHSLMFVLRGIGVFDSLATMTKLLGEDGLQAVGKQALDRHPRQK